MPLIRNTSFQTLDFQDASFMYGTGVLTPDAGGGFFGVVIPGLDSARSLVLACYDGSALFNAANAGFLLCAYDDPSSSLLVISSNIADNNTVRWFALR